MKPEHEMTDEERSGILIDYVNGELDPADRDACERMIAEHPATAALVAEFRRTTDTLRGALNTEPAAGLTEGHRDAVLAAVSENGADRHNDIDALGSAVERKTFEFPRTSQAAVLVKLFSVTAAALLIMGIGIATYFFGPRFQIDSRPTEALGPASSDRREPIAFDPRRIFFNRRRPLDAAVSPVVPGTPTAGGRIIENRFRPAATVPFSGSALRASTAGYEIVRRLLEDETMPAKASVRPHEMVNFFTYNYPAPRNGDPSFSLHLAAAACPWNEDRLLLRVAAAGALVEIPEPAPATLVFLLDLSPENRAIAAGAIAELAAVSGDNRRIVIVLRGRDEPRHLALPAGGGGRNIAAWLADAEPGNRAAGVDEFRYAYSLAATHRLEHGNNHLIFCTEGDFDDPENGNTLDTLIGSNAADGIQLTVLGFGMPYNRLPRIEDMARAGGGACRYVDSRADCTRQIRDKLSGRYPVIARDPRLRVEFNPATIAAWRLVGCSRAATDTDGDPDTSGTSDRVYAGHRYTALYEVIPVRAVGTIGGIIEDIPPRYHPEAAEGAAGELITAVLQYTSPTGEKMTVRQSIKKVAGDIADCDGNFRFAAAVSGFALLLRNSAYCASYSLEAAGKLAAGAADFDPRGYRKEFIRVIALAEKLNET